MYMFHRPGVLPRGAHGNPLSQHRTGVLSVVPNPSQRDRSEGKKKEGWVRRGGMGASAMRHQKRSMGAPARMVLWSSDPWSP